MQCECSFRLGVTVEENPRELGGGVSIVALEGGSRAERSSEMTWCGTRTVRYLKSFLT